MIAQRLPLATKRAPATHRHRPKKSLGQHFLRDDAVVWRIAGALDLTENSTVIEIGPGEGVLTRELSQRASRVIAIELDDELAARLRREFAGSNVEIVHADALEVDPARLVRANESFVLAGNLPYNVAQPLLRRYLEGAKKPEKMVVMVQSEVADGITAGPGKLTVLGISVQVYGEPKVLFRVPPSAFRPPPKVQSAVVRINVAPRLRADVDDVDAFFRVVKAGFSSRRKQLRNSLANALAVSPVDADNILRAARIEPTLRAQALTLDQWADLTNAWSGSVREETSHAG